MLPRLLLIGSWIKRKLWSLVLAYMLGMHNFYHGDNKTVDNISRTVEINEAEENDVPAAPQQPD